jgi:ABC-type polysaccharide/polyol phosphate export permease
MFDHARRPRNQISSGLAIVELIYHATVRSIRAQHGNAFAALLINIMQAVLFVTAFYLMFVLIGVKSAGLRGDFILYILTGVFLFMTHTKSLGSVAGAEGPASPMMQHAPMTTVISIASSALSTLYIQVLSLSAILFIYHMTWKPLEIHDPIGAFAMLLLAWFTGCALGMIMLALKPWLPNATRFMVMAYQRANMIASGKMFVANTLPGFMLAMFDWNPLFHTIDQARGHTFLNYVPRNTSWEYAFYVGLTCLVIGLMGEFYTRKYSSASWSARL